MISNYLLYTWKHWLDLLSFGNILYLIILHWLWCPEESLISGFHFYLYYQWGFITNHSVTKIRPGLQWYNHELFCFLQCTVSWFCFIMKIFISTLLFNKYLSNNMNLISFSVPSGIQKILLTQILFSGNKKYGKR